MTDDQKMRSRSRRDFLVLGAGAAAAIGGWEWLMHSPSEDGVPAPLRRVLAGNKRVTGGLLFSNGHGAPEFSRDRAESMKVNGTYGLDDDLDPAEWKLQLTPYGQAAPATPLDLAAVRQLPRVEHTTEFKCIEGWSRIVHWAGVRLSDFTARFAPGSERARFGVPSMFDSSGVKVPLTAWWR